MTGLRIVAHMGEPFVNEGDGLALDGIVSHGRYKLSPELHEAWRASLDAGVLNDLSLPFERWESEGVWGWVASVGRPIDPTHGTEYLRRRSPIRDYMDWTDSASEGIGSGRRKAYDLPISTVFARRVEWIAIGRKDLVRRNLRVVRSIGRKTGHGWGRVLRWTVLVDPGVTAAEVLARRWMPDPTGVPHAHRPPYWHPSRLIPMRPPLC